MTMPRPVVPGRTQFLSRRCTQRQHLLRPDAHVEETYIYCLGEAAQRFGISVHAYVAMSNHQHVLVRDNRGNLPEFMAHFHKMLAKSLNAYYGRWENVWATEQPNVVHLVEACDRFDKLVYLLLNPVAAHLVEKVADWPGASSYRQHLTGAPRTVKRPRGFFREDGPMPEEITLVLEPLEGFEHLSPAEWAEMLTAAVRQAESAAKAQRLETGARVLGRKAVLRTEPTSKPKTVEPRRGLRPLVACLNAVRRVHELLALRAFRAAYRLARQRWIAGEWHTVFPPGTYQLRALGVYCAPFAAR